MTEVRQRHAKAASETSDGPEEQKDVKTTEPIEKVAVPPPPPPSSSSDEEQEVKVSSLSQKIQQFVCYQFEPIDSSSVIVFRVLWGLLMCYESFVWTQNDYAKMHNNIYNPLDFNFKYQFFEWVQPFANPSHMKLFFHAMMAVGICISVGFFYHFFALCFFLMFGYLFLLDETFYLNHYYLIIIFSFFLIFAPFNHSFSIDAIIRPSIASKTIPRVWLTVIRAELFIVYTYAGVVKLNEDWLRGQPLVMWIEGVIVRGGDHTLPNYRGFPIFLAYSGLVYDFFVGTIISYRPTRALGFWMTMFFHCSNKLIFNIGVFPYFMMASTSFFFDGDWARWLWFRMKTRTRRWYRSLTKKNPEPPARYHPIVKNRRLKQVPIRKLKVHEKVILVGAIIFLLHQLLFPLRPYYYNTREGTKMAWTDYGHNFSWRMKLRSKHCLNFPFAYLPQARSAFEIDLGLILGRRTLEQMGGRPHLYTQVAKRLSQLYVDTDGSPGRIHFYSVCELNGRKKEEFVDITYDLASSETFAIPQPWLLPCSLLTEKERSEFIWNWDWSLEALQERLLTPLHDPSKVEHWETIRREEKKTYHTLAVQKFTQHIWNISNGNVTFILP